MKSINGIVVRFGIITVCALPLLAGCGKSADTANASADAPRSAAAVNAGMPEQARAIAAQHAQGAEFDAKRRAAAMAPHK